MRHDSVMLIIAWERGRAGSIETYALAAHDEGIVFAASVRWSFFSEMLAIQNNALVRTHGAISAVRFHLIRA